MDDAESAAECRYLVVGELAVRDLVERQNENETVQYQQAGQEPAGRKAFRAL